MYRRLESSLPPDFTFSLDLTELGYFINDKDQIRMIEDPLQPFNYHASKNEPSVEMQKEAFTEIVRRLIYSRLANLRIAALTLPRDTPRDQPHVPILASQNLDTASRIIVYIGEEQQDMGVFAGRLMSTEGTNYGSVVSFAHDVLVDSSSEQASAPLLQRGSKPIDKISATTAVAFANPGQLIWYRRGKRPVSYSSWSALPRKWGPGQGPLLTKKNRIPRNEEPVEHVRCLLEDFVEPLINKGMKVDIIAAGDAMESVSRVLDQDWARYKEGIEAIIICTANLYDLEMENQEFIDFWSRRARAYIIGSEPLDTPMTGRHLLGCNIFSSGSSDLMETIMPKVYKVFLDYFKLVHANPSYFNIPQDLPMQQAEEPIGWGVQDEEDVNIDVHLDSDEEGDDAFDKTTSDGSAKVAESA